MGGPMGSESAVRQEPSSDESLTWDSPTPILSLGSSRNLNDHHSEVSNVHIACFTWVFSHHNTSTPTAATRESFHLATSWTWVNATRCLALPQRSLRGPEKMVAEPAVASPNLSLGPVGALRQITTVVAGMGSLLCGGFSK